MKYKKSMIILIILTVFLFGIADACASDVDDAAVACEDSMSIESMQNNNFNADEILTDNPKTFTQLDSDINESQDTFEVKYDYTFYNQSDDGPVVIDKSDFTINGNNHVLDGNRQSGIFFITGNNVTISNLVFINGNSFWGGAIYASGLVTLNNVTFIANNANRGGAIYSNGQMTLDNATFIDNNASCGGAIAYFNNILNCINSRFAGNNAGYGGAIYSNGQVTLDNATFISNNAGSGGAILYSGNMLNCINSRFIDNSAEEGSSITLDNALLNVCNSFFTSNRPSKYGQIMALISTVNIVDSQFINISSTYSSALCLLYSESSIVNSRFVNLTADKSAGAIAIRYSGNSYIKGCEFANTKSFKNAGAILVDYGMESYNAAIIDCVFRNASSIIGGAYVQLGGGLLFNNTCFADNKASCDGGAVYISCVDGEFYNCNFTSNAAGHLTDYSAHGGAIHSDLSILKVCNSSLINNSAYLGNAIYACDSKYDISYSTFLNNAVAIFTDFDFESCNLENNVYNNDSVITNQSYSYATYVCSPALDLKLVNNTIDVDSLPSRFDLREWGLVTSVKDQGFMGACWAFGMVSAVESALLKAYGLEFDLSEGNMHHNMIRYSPYGDLKNDEGGFLSHGVSYLVGWFGPALEETDPYDEMGKLSPFLSVGYDVIHIQDVVIVRNDDVPAGFKVKSAILNYGALGVSYHLENDGSNGYYNPENSAQYIDESLEVTHSVSLIGWDDGYSKDNFLITPPGDGAWIVKNSWGTEWGDEGIVYVSYYDKTFLPGGFIDDNAFGIVIENTLPYNKNYQHDFLWSHRFVGFGDDDELTMYIDDVDVNRSIAYANQFEAAGDDLIAAVGTYFNETGVNYTAEIYVNGELKLIQEGLSPFCGYHTIRLNEYVPIKKGDMFKAVITSNVMPFCFCSSSRLHYTENTSFYYDGHDWKDLFLTKNLIACLKVYTLEDVDNIINYTFKDLNNHINESADVLEIIHDYTFDNESDDGPVVIDKSNFTINGNNHVLDGNKQSGIFNITGNNVTISNLVFVNGNASKGGAIYSTDHIVLKNVTFIGNNADCGGAIACYNATLDCSDSRFIDNSVKEGGPSIYCENSTLNVCSSFFTSVISNRYGQIYTSKSTVSIEDSQFINITSDYAPALYFEHSRSSISNSRFVNLTANISAGAIAIKWSGNSYIKGCEFTNTKSFKNAGAVHVDYGKGAYNATIFDCIFSNASSMIGGAYIQLGGNLFLNGSKFTDNKASCDGGAVYISYTTSEIHNCSFTSNAAGFSSDYIAYGGAIYCDKSNLDLANSSLINNSAYQGNAIYACDSCYDITDCLFLNNTNAIYSDFDDDSCNLENNCYNNDTVITNQTFSYQRFIDTPALNLTLINNTINVVTLPSRFDLRDWGLVTPVKDQGRVGACWTFGMISAVESAMLKAFGIEFDLSEGNLFHNMLRYFPYGYSVIEEGGTPVLAVSYLVGWYGPALEENDVFDEVGKLSPFMTTDYDVFHIQDVIILPNDDVPEGSKIKTAILNYGAVVIGYCGQTDDSNGYYNTETHAHYINESLSPNHMASLIGWDDHFSRDNFLIAPPGDGAWIVKNSWGTDWGDDGILYISYYDKTFLDAEYIEHDAFGIVIENTINYNKNYQHDFLWTGEFMDMNKLRDIDGAIIYANQFEAVGDDLIAAVGTYFNETGVNYTVEIYVNDELKLTQGGMSPFCGYHTIKLNEYVPVKTGDVFKAVIASNTMPFCECPCSRMHYTENVSFFYYDGEWVDLYAVDEIIACLKVYTVEDADHIINYTFKDLNNHINWSGDVLELMHDYTFNNQSDDGSVLIDKSNFTINGNNHVLDGNKQSGIFNITANNVTINNLVFINGNSTNGGAIYSTGRITLNNVTFIGNNAGRGGAIVCYDGTLDCSDSRFIDNSVKERGPSIYSENATLNVCGSFFTSGISNRYGQIFASKSTVSVEDSQFINISSDYAPALYFEDSESSIINSRFVNLTAGRSAGAIAIRWSGDSYIQGCEFTNTKSFKNAGAVIVDYGRKSCYAAIIDCVFRNASSMIGGAFIQLGGGLFLADSKFIDNKASCDGGAVYVSFTTSVIQNCSFTSNDAGFSSDYIAYGGAIYCDKGYLELVDSGFINNSAYLGNAIYSCDSWYDITDCIFANNTNAIYSDFDYRLCNLENNTYNNDSIITNQSFSYQRVIDTPALNLTLINNTINVATLPSRFDLRDWGLVTPVKNQGRAGACWTFGMINAVESAMLKAFGIEFDLSEGNLLHNMLKYFPYGYSVFEESGAPTAAVSYLVGWYGPALEENDVFDEVGKLSPFMTTDYDVFHIQDVIIVPNDEVPEGSKIKTAILNYGAVEVCYYGEHDDANGYYNPETFAQYVNESIGANHAVSVIGWDDNFSKDNFLITPPGDGAWIIKNSWGTDWGDNGIGYISYYDKTFLTGGNIDNNAFGIVIENTIHYNKNYQHDFLWAGDFVNMDQLRGVDGAITYANQFEAADDDLIAAVGTYFNESGVNYTVEIYVNNELKLTQDGVSPFCGYYTIKLNEYIPIKTGDVFKAVMTSNSMPYCRCSWSRVHYTENVSFFYYGGEWMDLYTVENKIACLKVYTVEDTDHLINYTFKDLARHIDGSQDVLEMMHDYTFDSQSDDGPVLIDKSDFTINGNNHVLDANRQSGIFNITGNNVTINNLVFVNGNASKGGAIYAKGHITLNNVTFIANNASRGGAIACYNATLDCSDSRFIDNCVKERGASIYSDNATLNFCNTFFTSSISNRYGQIFASSSTVSVEDSQFINITSDYAPALYFEGSGSSIINSVFVNLTADKSAGAIAIRRSGNSYIKGCEFTNTKSFKNAGAIIVDYGMESFNATIIDCVFDNASSMIGGAFIQLGGNLILRSSNFTGNRALVGGAAYVSFANATIDDCIFDSNGVSDDNSRSYGGAIVCDMANMTLAGSRFINNSAYLGNAVYACESWYNVTNCLFENNTNAIFTDFDKNGCNLNSNEYNNDSIITNQSFYAPTSFAYQGLNLTLINNTINVTTLPSKFDSRDWGWTTPVKDQGRMGACWTFAFVEALETSLLKATGIRYDVSENYMQNLQIRYSDFGCLMADEGGNDYMALANVVSWLGVSEKEESYDEVGKLSVFVDSANRIRLQDVCFIIPNAIDYVGDVKRAILDYGAVSISYASSLDEPYFNEKTSAHYTNESLLPNHGVAVIGWDDNYSADNFLIAPPGDGAWIVKNSWGTEWGDKGYFYLSYYEKSLFARDPDTNESIPIVACVFTNAIDYHANYQTDLTGLGGFDGNYTQYSNEFTAEYDDLIAGIGTFFNQSGIDYSLDIYVNNNLVYSQNGISDFAGYRTIILNNYVPVKVNDTFRIVFKSNALPYEAKSRNHYIHGMSFVSANGSTWSDITLENKTVCLKVYTVADDSKIIKNNDVSVDYDGGKYFTVNVVTGDGRAVVGASVKFTINGKTTDVKTGSGGIAKIRITDVPKKYTITTSYNNNVYRNTVTVKQVITASKITVKKTAKKFTLKAKLKINGKLVKGKTVTFKFNGKTYKVKTNSKGIAQKILKKNVIKKLKKGKTYTVKVTYLKDTIKTTVKV